MSTPRKVLFTGANVGVRVGIHQDEAYFTIQNGSSWIDEPNNSFMLSPLLIPIGEAGSSEHSYVSIG